ncbi:MAG: hypothetical protein ACR2L1_08005 [Pyrinomonadaceae bacterium]
MEQVNKKVYHISPLRRFILLIVFTPIFLMLIPLLTSPVARERYAGLFAGAILAANGLIGQFIIDRTKLTISSEGVKLNQTTFSIETTWENIAELRMTPGSERFVTVEPPTGKGLWHIDLLLKGNGEKSIPIDAFAWHIRRGTLAEDIARFAPDLVKTL